MEWKILAAFILDLLLGDPEGLPHPVREIGRACQRGETLLRRLPIPLRWSGLILTAGLVGGTALLTWGLIVLAGALHPWLQTALEIYFIYAALSVRDLAEAARRVRRALGREGLEAGRRAVSRIVGRDTDRLDEAGVARAAIESVGESTVDGILSPLFYAALGGAPLAMAFKAASTLDSMIGYKDERYREFGWAAAKLDDLLNFIPARLGILLFWAAAALANFNPKQCWKIIRRDRAKHPSPNSGIGEAAMAGALGVQLGGPSFYGGELVEKPFIGEALRPVEIEDIGRANRLMMLTSVVAVYLTVCFSLLLKNYLIKIY